MALSLYLAEGETSYPLELYARPVGLKEAGSRELAAVRQREVSGAQLEPGNVTRGGLVFTRFACSGCHSLSNEKLAGPPLNGIASRVAKGLDAHLRSSILTPNKEIAEGYQPAMPSFAGVLPPQDLEDLVAYLKTLK
jgi:cytochrome c oxidase subunit 2